MREYTLPYVVKLPSCIVLNSNSHNFKIKPRTLSIISSFYGLLDQSPYDHIMKFEQSSSMIKPYGLPADDLRFKLFPFTLKDTTRRWLSNFAPLNYLMNSTSRSFFCKVLSTK